VYFAICIYLKPNMKKFKFIVITLFISCFSAGFVTAQQQVSYVPERSDVNLYQINIRTFSKDGNLKGILPRLDSIKNLGMNVIYLMPIYPVGKVNAVNSPYCVKDYKLVNEEFGKLEDLKTLVNAIHERKMAVILDWVPNHTSYDHVWIKNKSWYLQDSTGKILSPPGQPWSDVAQLNFNNMDMRAEMISSMKYWVATANVDGFRCDYADGPTYDFWKQAVAELRAIPDHKLLLLAEGKRADHYKAGFDYNFGFTFFEHLKDIYGKNRSVLSIDTINVSDHKGTTNGQQIVRYTTNHDVNGSDGTPQDLFGGQKGSMAAFVVAAYMNSIPMIYNGQEVGTPYKLVFPFTGQKVDWSLNPAVTAEYKKIIAIRNSSAALRTNKVKSYSSDDICAFTKEKDKEKVLVLANLRNKEISYTTPKKLSGSKWTDAISGAVYEVGKNVVLPPYAYLVLKK
jgi:glycosidase